MLMSFPSRILLVEDEQLLAQNLKTFLERHAADVRIADNGEQAIAMLPSFAPEVAVLDYGLPGINGLQTYREIARRSQQRIGCVMITGYPLDSISKLAGKHGIRHLLGKPFSLTELQQHVHLSAEESSGVVL
jgi:two-component system, NtrC family, response regulator AtoC